MRHLAVIALVVLLAAPAAQCADSESSKVFRSRSGGSQMAIQRQRSGEDKAKASEERARVDLEKVALEKIEQLEGTDSNQRNATNRVAKWQSQSGGSAMARKIGGTEN